MRGEGQKEWDRENGEALGKAEDGDGAWEDFNGHLSQVTS